MYIKTITKRFWSVAFALTMLACDINAQNVSEKKNKPIKKAVFILVDGIAYDMLSKTPTPNLDAIAKNGTITQAYVGGKTGSYSQTPTISAVGYNSMLTGTWVHKHNVFGNGIKKPNYNYPTIFKLFKDAYPTKKAAIFSTWLDNRTKLIGENLTETGRVQLDYAYDGFELDTLNFPHDKEREYIKNIDKKVAFEAARYIKKEAPDLSWVYLEFSDDMGHKYGDSKQLYDAITFEDSLIGNIWDAVTYREKNFNEEWLVVITTDHGRTAKDGKGHGGQTARERSTWIVSNAQLNNYARQSIPGIIDVMPTIANYMDVHIPNNIKHEVDGLPLIGNVDAYNLQATKKEGSIELTWNNLQNNEVDAKILISKTNNFKKGGKDVYETVGACKLKDEKVMIKNISSSKFLKIILQTPHNSLNTWIVNNN